MTELSTEPHVVAAQRQLRLLAWGEHRVDTAWRELTLRRVRDEAKSQRTKRIAGPLLAAATLALAVVGWRVLTPSNASNPSPVAAQEAGVERLVLGEGTDVRLDKGARFEVREREVDRVVVAVKTGLARFRVRHDPERVFRVHAGDVEVEDIGTTFEVENKDGSVRVAVTEGSVMVSFPRAEGDAGGKILLRAGDSGVYPAIARGAEPSDRGSAEPAAPPSSTGEAAREPREASAGWRELARSGKHRRAYEVLAPGDFRDLRDEPGDLLLASDVARLSHHSKEAAGLLRRLLAGHSRDPRAPSAAFTLGWVLMNELGRPREAAAAFARAEALAPRGNLAEDAVARAVEAWVRAGELGRARAEVDRYRKSYPQGRHLGMLDRLTGAE
jgi:transmembrane sensor